ncbi:DUF1580 domain-containing protein [bacterium]|nr:DUF1580 domain-containing protein [bacterium]
MTDTPTAAAEPSLFDEIAAGDVLTLAGVAAMFPAHRGKGRMNPSAVFRWATTGTKTRDGRSVLLGTVRVGHRLLTSKAAVARYVAAISHTPAAATPQPTPTARRGRGEQAAAELERLGA